MIESEEKKYYTPLIVGEAILPAHTKPENFKYRYIEGKRQQVYLVEVSKEVYDEIANSENRANLKKRRHAENAAKKGECYADPLSLDSLGEEINVGSPSATMQLNLALTNIAFEQIVRTIEKTNSLYGPILRLTRDGLTQREIAKALGKSQATIMEQQQTALKLLRKLSKE